jgi:hypothetical protein
MRAFIWLLGSLLALAALGAVGAAWMTAAPQAPAAPAETPRGVREVLYARPFVLEESYRHTWRSDQPEVQAGWILVLDVDPALVVPRQVAEPVLYVGDQTAERLNHGDQSGHVIAIVPSPLDLARGAPELDPAKAAMWFGTPRLPERVDPAVIAAERAAAVRAGIAPLAASSVAKAEERGGALAVFKDRTQLEREAAALMQVWSPEDYDLARTMLAPLVK